MNLNLLNAMKAYELEAISCGIPVERAIDLSRNVATIVHLKEKCVLDASVTALVHRRRYFGLELNDEEISRIAKSLSEAWADAYNTYDNPTCARDLAPL